MIKCNSRPGSSTNVYKATPTIYQRNGICQSRSNACSLASLSLTSLQLQMEHEVVVISDVSDEETFSILSDSPVSPHSASPRSITPPIKREAVPVHQPKTVAEALPIRRSPRPYSRTSEHMTREGPFHPWSSDAKTRDQLPPPREPSLLDTDILAAPERNPPRTAPRASSSAAPKAQPAMPDQSRPRPHKYSNYEPVVWDLPPNQTPQWAPHRDRTFPARDVRMQDDTTQAVPSTSSSSQQRQRRYAARSTEEWIEGLEEGTGLDRAWGIRRETAAPENIRWDDDLQNRRRQDAPQGRRTQPRHRMDTEAVMSYRSHGFTERHRRDNRNAIVKRFGAMYTSIAGWDDDVMDVVDRYVYKNWDRILSLIDDGEIGQFVNRPEFIENFSRLKKTNELFQAMPTRVQFLMSMWTGTSWTVERQDPAMPEDNPVIHGGYANTLLARAYAWAFDHGLIGSAKVRIFHHSDVTTFHSSDVLHILCYTQAGNPVPPPIVCEIGLWRCLPFLTDWRIRKWIFRLMVLRDAALKFTTMNGNAITMENSMASWRCRHANADFPDWVFTDASENTILYSNADGAHELRSRAYQFACRQGFREIRNPTVWGLGSKYRQCLIQGIVHIN